MVETLKALRSGRVGFASQPTEMVSMKTPTCRFCKSALVVRAGWRYNRNGRKRRFLCKACSVSPSTTGFLGMWYTKQTITKAVDLYQEGSPPEK